MEKIILNIPDNEFGVDIQNKFQDFFGRVKAEIETRVKSGDTLVCGAYEIETAEMFLKAFEQMEIVDDSTLKESISLLKANVMVACDTSPKVGYNTPLNKAIENALRDVIACAETNTVKKTSVQGSNTLFT
jgi:hypothetical protein